VIHRDRFNLVSSGFILELAFRIRLSDRWPSP